MKNLKSPKLLAVVAALIALVTLTPGCSTVERLFIKKQTVEVRPARTNMVDIVTTNLVPVVEEKVETVVIKPAEQNADGTITPAVIDTRKFYTTNSVPTLVTSRVEVVTPAITYDERTINPSVIQGAERAASLTGVPWLDTAATALGTLGTIIFGVLNRRNRDKALRLANGITEKESKFQEAKRAAEVVVENFEELRKTALKIPGYAEHDAKVMRVVQQAQTAMGVKPFIAQIVEEKTDFTKS